MPQLAYISLLCHLAGSPSPPSPSLQVQASSPIERLNLLQPQARRAEEQQTKSQGAATVNGSSTSMCHQEINLAKADVRVSVTGAGNDPTSCSKRRIHLETHTA